MEHIQPYSDGKMLYNEETKQYELQPAWVKANFGNPFNDDNTLSVRIKRNTRKVYNYIFSHGFSGNRRAIIAIINHTEEYRNYIFDALSNQMEADLASGYNDQDLFVPKSMDERNMQFYYLFWGLNPYLFVHSQHLSTINKVLHIFHHNH